MCPGKFTLHQGQVHHILFTIPKSTNLRFLFSQIFLCFVFLGGKGYLLRYNLTIKVEKVQGDSLDSIPSPLRSVKIQIIGGKVYFSCIGKTLLGVVNKLLKTKSLLTSPSNVSFLPQVNLPANNLNFY